MRIYVYLISLLISAHLNLFSFWIYFKMYLKKIWKFLFLRCWTRFGIQMLWQVGDLHPAKQQLWGQAPCMALGAGFLCCNPTITAPNHCKVTFLWKDLNTYAREGSDISEV